MGDDVAAAVAVVVGDDDGDADAEPADDAAADGARDGDDDGDDGDVVVESTAKRDNVDWRCSTRLGERIVEHQCNSIPVHRSPRSGVASRPSDFLHPNYHRRSRNPPPNTSIGYPSPGHRADRKEVG